MNQPFVDEWSNLKTEIIHCQLCPRLVAYRQEVARTKRKAYQEWTYWGKPVPGFGDPSAEVLVVGLAPGPHGSNRTGRMFTGDGSGDFLFPALYRAGFASQPTSKNIEDGLILKNMFITAVGRCAPPDNKPTIQELDNCQPFLVSEMYLLENTKVIVVLGKIAFDRVIGIFKKNGNQLPRMEFKHGGLYRPMKDSPYLLCSYHPSRQNTQTGRLTEVMFDGIWQQANDLLK